MPETSSRSSTRCFAGCRPKANRSPMRRRLSASRGPRSIRRRCLLAGRARRPGSPQARPEAGAQAHPRGPDLYKRESSKGSVHSNCRIGALDSRTFRHNSSSTKYRAQFTAPSKKNAAERRQWLTCGPTRSGHVLRAASSRSHKSFTAPLRGVRAGALSAARNDGLDAGLVTMR
jgi:hypothetical protein